MAAAILDGPTTRAEGSPVTVTVTVTVDRSTQAGTSQLSLGVTHTNTTVLGGNATAVAGARSLLTKAVTYQNVFIYGWGSTNPEPSPGNFNWTSLDQRLAMIQSMGATPIITLCCAPDWMTDVGTDTSNYCNGFYIGCLPPAPPHYADFADLVRQIALRYPYVKYYVVWNEMKGFFQPDANQWDIVSYTDFYNTVYDTLKAVDPSIQVGGPYLVIEGTGTNTGPWFTWSPVTQRNLHVLQYFLQQAHGADFVSLDRNVKDYHDPRIYTEAQKLALTHTFGDVVTQVRSITNAPIWYSEPHFAGQQGGGLLFQGAGNASILLHEAETGAALSLNWEPEPQSNGVIDDNLFTSTLQAGGGQPYPTYYSYLAFHDYFPPGTALYQATSSSPGVEVLASATNTLLINKTPSSLAVAVNGATITLGGYEVRILDQNGKTMRFGSNPPVIVSPQAKQVVPSSFNVTGGAEPQAQVEVFDGNTLIGTTSAAGNGMFSLAVAGLSAGTHTLTATAMGPYRTQSPASTPVTVTVSTSLRAMPLRNPTPAAGTRGAASA
ncbi:MAG TPA: Ig-like domain repeat protein, partial [Streptosporangiaceae bacterium]|nr:Ig-like domain repeat protein [Streptosporangiaceae bacterium]